MFTKKERGYTGPSSIPGTWAVFLTEHFLRVVALYTAINTLHDSHLPVTVFAFWVLVLASVFAIGIERVWKKPLVLKRRQYVSLASNGAAMAFCLFGLLYLVKICGPIRTLVVQHSETVFTALLGAATGRRLAPGKARSVAIAMFGIAAMVWFSNAGPVGPVLLDVAPAGGVDGADLQSPGRLLLAADVGGEPLAPPPPPPDVDPLESGLSAPPGAAPPEDTPPAAEDDPLGPDEVDVVDAKGVHHHIKRLGAAVVHHAHKIKSTLDAEDKSSVFAGGFWLIVVVMVSSSWRKVSRRAAGDAGGRKRFNALSLPLGVVAMSPFVLYQLTWNWSVTESEYSVFSPSVVWAAANVAAFVVVLPEYLIGVTSTKIDDKTAKVAGALASAGFATAYAALRPGDVQLTYMVLPAAAATIFGVRSLLAPVNADGSPAAWDKMIGGLADSTGMFHDDDVDLSRGGAGTGTNMGKNRTPFSVVVRKVMRHVMEDSNSRKIAMFLSINLAFMFVEFLVGFLTNSLGLISDAGHMAFDNASLLIGLYAAYMAKLRRDEDFTYGRSRYEVVGGFVNAIFLVCIAVAIVLEGLERLWEPPEVDGNNLLLVSVLGLVVNLVGLFFFHEAHSHAHGSGGCSGHGHGGSENMKGIFLHVLADTLGSVGVIISTLLIQWYGWHIADPIASLAISILILLSVIPLVTATAGTLLSCVPDGMVLTLQDCLIQVARFPGVIKVTQPHFWQLQGNTLVGTLHVQVENSVDEQVMRKRVVSTLNHVGVATVTVQIEKEAFLLAASAASVAGRKLKQALMSSDLEFTADSKLPERVGGGGHHGHSHGGGGCSGHGHGGGHSDHGHIDHGHAHGGHADHGPACSGGHGDHGHAHGGHSDHGPACSDGHGDHGHAHGGHSDHGHAHGGHSDHGGSHGDHGHAHGGHGDHGHAHGGHANHGDHEAHDAHGHAHAGHADHGAHNDHGHAHGGPTDHGGGHGDHGHAHGAVDAVPHAHTAAVMEPIQLTSLASPARLRASVAGSEHPVVPPPEDAVDRRSL